MMESYDKAWKEFDKHILRPYENTGSAAKLFNRELKVFSYTALRHIAFHAFKAGVNYVDHK